MENEQSEELKRYEQPNPYNYTKLELSERKKVLRDMERDYPNLPYAWLEMTYDFWKQTDPEKINEIIKSGDWEKPAKPREKSQN